jgi:glucan phosphoethanolaminetransferase (alkaline phosphatase superfamily)
MSLTSTTFQWLMIAVAIAATVSVLLLWNRVRGPLVVRLMSRGVLLIASYLTVAVAVLVSVNIAYGGLIATWSDLSANLHAPPGNWPHHRHHHRLDEIPPPMKSVAGGSASRSRT